MLGPPRRAPLSTAGHGFLLLALLAGCAAPGARGGGRGATQDSVDRLVGASPTALQALFGPPLLLRRDGPAEVWLYRSSACAIDLILYPDPSTGAPRVATADARPLGTPLSDADCLASLSRLRSGSAGRLAGGSL
jgi:hypothetical protein